MAYKPNFKWNDELVLEYARFSIKAKPFIPSEFTLERFKKFHEEKKREDRIKRVIVGKRGMNEDGSRFYYDCRGVKWNLKRIAVDNFTFYSAESERNEAVKDKFLSDIYLKIDKKAEETEETEIISQNNVQEILK